MKRKDKESLRVLGVAELASELAKRRQELFKLKFSRASSALKNPLRIRTLRKEIARIATWTDQKSKESSSVSK
ncbi:MAG: 50S ribosomal protein L29 [Elusimicrobiota bacterium]